MIRREVALIFGPSSMPRDHCVAVRMEPTTPFTKKVCPAVWDLGLSEAALALRFSIGGGRHRGPRTVGR